MTDLITAEEAKKLLDECDSDGCLTCEYARTVIALHAQLADAQAAQAMVRDRAEKAEAERVSEWNKRRDADSSRNVARAACDTMRAERDRLAAANAVLEAKVGRLVEAVIRVKPLDWQEGRFCGQDMFYAETPSGTWMVVCYSGRGFRWAVCDSQGNNSDEDWSTPELAKAAAQGDYDAEVRAALDLTTGPEQTSGWQPIETAPKDGLIDIWLSEGQRWCDCYYDRICDEWRTSRPSGKLVWIKAEHVTHWRPRTPAPAALATQEAGTC